MPCRDYDDNGASTIAYYRQRNDEFARMLCSMCAEFEARGIKLPPGVAPWYERHKEADMRAMEAKRKQEKEDKIRKDAMKKLTAQEAKLLGVDRYGHMK